MPTKKSLQPFVGKAKLHTHIGKGALQTDGQKPSRADVAQLTAPDQPPAGPNDYAKQTPMAQGASTGSLPGLGTGDFPGIAS